MNLILECKHGHKLDPTMWVDSDNNLRLIVPACAECDGVTLEGDYVDYLERLDSTMRRTMDRAAVGTGTAGGALPRGVVLEVACRTGRQSEPGA